MVIALANMARAFATSTLALAPTSLRQSVSVHKSTPGGHTILERQRSPESHSASQSPSITTVDTKYSYRGASTSRHRYEQIPISLIAADLNLFPYDVPPDPCSDTGNATADAECEVSQMGFVPATYPSTTGPP